MNALITYLSTIPAGAVLGWIVAVVSALICIYTWAERYRKVRNKYEDTEQKVAENAAAINQQHEQRVEFEKKIEQQIRHLEEHDEYINGKLDETIEEIKNINAYQKKRDINSLKDKILHSYKTYSSRAKLNNGVPFLTLQEEEALTGLIESYNDAGGNSFIHKTIEPNIITWEIVSEEELLDRMK